MDEQKSFLMYLVEMVEQYRADRRHNAPQKAQPRPGRPRRLVHWLTPNGGTLLLIAVLLLTQNVWARPDANPAAAPGPSATTVNYQGHLADPGGVPLSGTYGMSFSLWDAPTGGNLMWGPENHAAVPVSEGLFSVGLGGQTSGGIPTNVWNGDRYLEITVSGETLSPRELIRSVPIAGMALTVPDGTITGDKLANTFGSSGQPLLNFVPYSRSSPALELNASIDYTSWDLRSIIGDSAVAVVLHVRVADNVSGSYVGLKGSGTPQRVIMASGHHGGEYKGYGEVTILCDENQTIQYKLESDGGVSVEAQFHVVGWYEPVNTQ